MSVITEQVEVDVPVRTAYDQWTQFETFPEFMGGVEKVEQRTDTMTHWTTKIGGVKREFDAEIVDQKPDQQVTWRVVNGPKHDGTVMFLSEGAARTTVRLALDYEPQGATEKVGDMTGMVGAQVKEDLRRFKSFIEERGVQTGGWRGEVDPGSRDASGQ
ncbi:MAG: SRPBCC family protein [Micromonosporaceae bacterium]